MYHHVYIDSAGVSRENLDQMNAALESRQMFSLENEQKEDFITLDTVEVEE